MKISIRCYVVLFILSIQSIVSADLWQIIDNQTASRSISIDASERQSLNSQYKNALTLELNEEEMRLRLQARTNNATQAKLSKNADASTEANVHIDIPLPDGTITQLKLVPEKTLAKSLADKFPEITTYRVMSNENIFGGKVDMTHRGFHAMLQTLDGEVIFIDPIKVGSSTYVSYLRSNQQQPNDRNYSCGASSQEIISNDFLSRLLGTDSELTIQEKTLAARSAINLRNYRIAIATTGEYTAKHGGTVEGALSAITTTLSRVNQVLERDLGIHLSLVENNDLLINTDASSDPFIATKLTELVFQNQQFIDSVIGNENYDIGHLFSAGGGGLAAIASVCNSVSKAKGISGVTSPEGDSFDLDFVAHEIGHQLGATHTFNSSQGLCSGDTRTATTAFEPGSGSSIMSYAGYCGLDNLQSNTDAMFHIGSIKQVAAFTSTGQGSRCGTQEIFPNQPPISDAGKSYTIPSRTPFELTGKAFDADGDTLIYAWEQLDAGDSSAEYEDKGNNALFRVHMPSANKQQSFPPLNDILNHSRSKGATLPEHQRKLEFNFVVQDGHNVAQNDSMSIQVVRTGSRFALNMPRAQYNLGETYRVFWNVAETDVQPINCSNVDILLSTDGGIQFNQELAKNIANTGSAWITIPLDSQISSKGRFKLKCSNNIFYTVSYRDFALAEIKTPIAFHYNDEDQPEQDLKDTDINIVAVVNNVTNVAENTSTSGGGAFGLWWFFFGLLVIRRIIKLH